MSTKNSDHEKTLLGTLLYYLLVTIVLFFCACLWNTVIVSKKVPTVAQTQMD
jgi:hypothetical protein